MKKIISIFLASIMIIGVLTSCGVKEPKTQSQEEGTFGMDENGYPIISGASNSQGGAQNSTGSNAGNKPIQQINGRKIRVVMKTPAKGSFIEQTFKDTEKKYNCTFQFLSIDAITANDMLIKGHASGVAPFEMKLNDNWGIIPGALVNGTLLTLSDYYNFDADPKWSTSEPNNMHNKWNGKWYAMGFAAKAPDVMFYNKKILNQAGVKDPWNYVSTNSWTWDTINSDIAPKIKALNKGTNYTKFTIPRVYTSLPIIFGAKYFDISKAPAKFILGDTNNINKAINAINLLNNMISNKYVPTKDEEAGFGNSYTAFTKDVYAFYPYTIYYGAYLTTEAKKSIKDFGLVYWPKASPSDPYISPQSYPSRVFIVPRDVKDPETLVPILQDAVAFWGEGKTKPVSIQNSALEELQRDEYADILADSNYKSLITDRKSQVVNTYYLDFGDVNFAIDKLYDDVFSGKSSPAQAIEQNSSIIQGKLDKYK